MAKLDNVRISLKIDDLSNWNNSSVVLNDGEVALIRCPNNILKIKIGDGKTEINDLKYVNENLETLNQGISNVVDDKNLVAGFKLSALGDFQSVFGFNVEALSTDTFSFIWNGSSVYNYNDRYKSHGSGSFQVNPNNGLSGFWIGEQNMAQLLDKLYINGIKTNTLSIQHISQDDYHELIIQKNVLSNVLYIVSADTINAYNEQIKNVADGTDLSDAINLNQLCSAISSIDIPEIPTKVSVFENDAKYINETQLNTAINNINIPSIPENVSEFYNDANYANILIDNNIATTLEVKHISHDDYNDLVVNDTVLSNVLYLVSADTINAYNQRIENVADGIEDTDGVNLKQVKDLVKDETDRATEIENELDSKITEVDSKLNDFALKTDITEIENDLSNKIKVDGNNVDTLNIINISQSDYHDLVLAETVDRNTLYIISSDINNAYDERIENVADGIEDTDAVNVQQLKEYVNNAIATLNQNTYTLASQLKTANDNNFLLCETNNDNLDQNIEEFEIACEKFRKICKEIGNLIGNTEFKGGLNEMSEFQDLDIANTQNGLMLTNKWIIADKLCTYIADKKLNLGQYNWWEKCWNIDEKTQINNIENNQNQVMFSSKPQKENWFKKFKSNILNNIFRKKGNHLQ